MELRQLEIFTRVAALKSLTRAGEELFLTQPAVSRSIAALETELRTRLFDRLPRSVELTPAGQALLERSAQILLQTEKAIRAVSDVNSGDAGRLAIGASSTAATYVLPELLARYRATFPRVSISVQTGGSATVAEMVLRSEVDVGVIMGLSPREELIDIRLSTFETVVVMDITNSLASAANISVEEIAQEPLIVMQPGTNLRQYVDSLFRVCDLHPRISMEMDNVEAIKKMVEAGLGIALLPRLAVEREVKAGLLSATSVANNPVPNRRISVIHREDRFVFRALERFVELLKQELSSPNKS
jgi:DNA-binding transcriptional LysR family regulator